MTIRKLIIQFHIKRVELCSLLGDKLCNNIKSIKEVRGASGMTVRENDNSLSDQFFGQANMKTSERESKLSSRTSQRAKKKTTIKQEET